MQLIYLFAGLFFAASAQSAIVEIKFDEGGRFQHAGSVPPGKFVEVCGKISGGQKIAWTFETTAAVDFNIHYHVGEKVEYPEKVSAVAKREGTLDRSSSSARLRIVEFVQCLQGLGLAWAIPESCTM